MIRAHVKIMTYTLYTITYAWKMSLIKDFIILNVVVSFCYGDYTCLCNYNVETPVYGSADKSRGPIGYMYEFDCKYLIAAGSPSWITIAFEHMTGFVENTSGTRRQTCPGYVPEEDKLFSTIETTTTFTTLAKTMTKTPITNIQNGSSFSSTALPLSLSSTLPPHTASISSLTQSLSSSPAASVLTTLSREPMHSSSSKGTNQTLMSSSFSDHSIVSPSLSSLSKSTLTSLLFPSSKSTLLTFPNTSNRSKVINTITTVKPSSFASTSHILSYSPSSSFSQPLSSQTHSFISGTSKSASASQSSIQTTLSRLSLPSSSSILISLLFLSTTPSSSVGSSSATLSASSLSSSSYSSSASYIPPLSFSKTFSTTQHASSTNINSKPFNFSSHSLKTTTPTWAYTTSSLLTKLFSASTPHRTTINLLTHMHSFTNASQSNVAGSTTSQNSTHYPYTATLSSVSTTPHSQKYSNTRITGTPAIASSSSFHASSANLYNLTTTLTVSYLPSISSMKTVTLPLPSTKLSNDSRSSESVISVPSTSASSSVGTNSTATPDSISSAFTTERVDLCPYKNLAMSMYDNKSNRYPLFHQYGNYCYELRLQLGSWYKGQKDCVDRGGELVVINSKEVQARVYDLVSSLQRKLDVWIGLHDLHQEGIWEWVDGDELTKKGFNNGVLINPVYNDGRDCVVMDGTTGIWKNTACQSILFNMQSNPWVCQYKIS